MCSSNKKNLILISKFYDNNSVSIESFPSSFLVKDLHTGKPFAQGQNKHGVFFRQVNKLGVYELPTTATILNLKH